MLKGAEKNVLGAGPDKQRKSGREAAGNWRPSSCSRGSRGCSCLPDGGWSERWVALARAAPSSPRDRAGLTGSAARQRSSRVQGRAAILPAKQTGRRLRKAGAGGSALQGPAGGGIPAEAPLPGRTGLGGGDREQGAPAPFSSGGRTPVKVCGAGVPGDAAAAACPLFQRRLQSRRQPPPPGVPRPRPSPSPQSPGVSLPRIKRDSPSGEPAPLPRSASLASSLRRHPLCLPGGHKWTPSWGQQQQGLFGRNLSLSLPPTTLQIFAFYIPLNICSKTTPKMRKGVLLPTPEAGESTATGVPRF